MKKPPIIFIHKGNSSYLKYTLNHAKFLNCNSEVILIGDSSNNIYNGILHYEMRDYFKGAKEFEEEYYLHMSKNPYDYELFCYQRWFILYEFIKEHNYHYTWFLDSDTLLTVNLSRYISEISKKKYDLIGQINPQNGSFNPSINFFSINIIIAITHFLKDSYITKDSLYILKNKWKFHLKKGLPGGVCDMTQLGLFLNNQISSSFQMFDIYCIDNELIPDGNINLKSNFSVLGVEFKKHLGFKLITIENYGAFAYLNNGEKVPIMSIHFQGTAKNRIKYYTTKYYNPLNLLEVFKLLPSIFLNQLKVLIKNIFFK